MIHHSEAVAVSLALILSISLAVRKASDVPRPFLANKQCRLIISEIDVFPGGGYQFVEIIRVCHPEPKNVFNVNMDKKYKLIFVDHSGFLVGVCNLKGEAQRRSTSGKQVFYVIGGSKVKNVDMSLRECEFAADTDSYAQDNLPESSKAPIAAILVYHPKGLLSWLSLKEERYKKFKVPLTNDLEEKIVPLVVDMYIYTTWSPYTSCDYFGTFYHGYKKDTQLILREWVPYGSDRALSRCNPNDIPAEHTWDPMQPTYFQYAKATPGDMNECKTAVSFRIEDTQPVRDPPLVHFRTTPEYACYITTKDPLIDSIKMITSAGNYHAALMGLIREKEGSQLVTENVALPLSPLTAETNPKPKPMSPTAFHEEIRKSIPHFWTDCEKFEQKEFIASLRNEKNPYIKPEHILKKDVCNWLEYITPHSFRCKLCNALWNQEIIFDRPGSSLLNAVKSPRAFHTGQSHSIPFKNKQLIEKHMSGEMHKLAVDYFELSDSKKSMEELNEDFYREGGPMRNYLQPTAYRFLAVLQSTRMDIPFYKQPIMYQTLHYYDVKIGHLYDTPPSAKTITMSISNTLHEDLVQDLLIRQPELSILIDTATDIATIASLGILFQTYDKNNKIVVHLYKLLPAGRRESGESLFSIFQAQLQKDGLTDYVKDKCVGFASDGGSNMKKFRRLLGEWTNTELVTVHCFAHKLDLALKHSWEEMHYLNDVDETVNGLYRIFNSKSHTKKVLLHETADELGYKRFELKRIVPTRWINTKRRAMATVLANWKVLVVALEKVISDRSTRRIQREHAKLIESSLKDPTLIATMAFIADVCEELAAVSVELQRRGKTLISKKEMRDNLVAALNLLKTSNGNRLQALLDKAKLPEESNRNVHDIVEFETEDIKVDGVLLHPYELDENSLQNRRETYINKIVEEIKDYFPNDATDNLEILDPSKWTAENIQHFGNTEILLLNQHLRWGYQPAQILQNWIDLKTLVYGSPSFLIWKQKRTEDFWVHFLNPGSDIEWPQSLQTIITNILVTPASTAEVERIFSLYTNIKTVQRYSLDVLTVEALVRIKFNGPKDPAEFDAPRFARNFIRQLHSRANDESRRRRKRWQECPDFDAIEVNGLDVANGLQSTEGQTLERLDFGEAGGMDQEGVCYPADQSFREIVFNGDEIEVANYEEDDEIDGDYDIE